MGRSGQIRSLKSLRSAKERRRGFCTFPFPVVALTTCQSHVDSVPVFRAGEEVYLFLWRGRGPGAYVLGWAQGTFRITRDVNSGVDV